MVQVTKQSVQYRCFTLKRLSGFVRLSTYLFYRQREIFLEQKHTEVKTDFRFRFIRVYFWVIGFLGIFIVF